ncbi:hypothetical protein BGZ80_007921, partial [Entomortierella chlamydospora]
MSFDNKDVLDRYLDAVQKVVDRHDILRTAIIWENLSVPAQVVLRNVKLSIVELSLDPTDGDIINQISRLTDPQDHPQTLADPQPFRNLIAKTREGQGAHGHEHFFVEMLTEIDTPALPYGLSDVRHDGFDVTESHVMLSQDLNNRLRGQAKRMGVSLASLCHLAWTQVVSRTSGQEQVVFGTVLLGRMQGGSGSDRAMGLFINTLPIRIDVRDKSVERSVRQTQADLAALLEHEHASLALAQRCSSVASGTPLFSTLLNYRHNTGNPSDNSDIPGMTVLDGQERTNYPFMISVEDG